MEGGIRNRTAMYLAGCPPYLDATTLAEFFSGPGGRQTGAIFLVFGIPRDDDSDSTKHSMNPGNEAQTSIGCVQTDDPRPDLIQTHRPCQQALCKGGIVWVGRRQQKQER